VKGGGMLRSVERGKDVQTRTGKKLCKKCRKMPGREKREWDTKPLTAGTMDKGKMQMLKETHLF
jgi:hypothetical protein